MKKMKERILAIHKRMLTQGFNKFKGGLNKEKHEEMVFEFDNLQNANMDLDQELSQKKAVREKQKV